MRIAMVIRVQHFEQMSAALYRVSNHITETQLKVADMIKMIGNTVLPAAAPDIIIICHVNIKHQLLLQGLESSWLHCVVLIRLQVAEGEEGITQQNRPEAHKLGKVYKNKTKHSLWSYPVAVDCSNINLVWVHLLHFLLQLVLGGKRLVADVDIIFQCEGELTVLKVILLHWNEKMVGIRKKEYVLDCLQRSQTNK